MTWLKKSLSRRSFMASGLASCAALPLLRARSAQAQLFDQIPELRNPRQLRDFSFRAQDGARVRLSDFLGQPVLLNLWATWCGPCQEELPSLNRLAQRYAPKGLVILAISVDEENATSVVPQFLEDNGYTSLTPYYDDEGGASQALMARGIPTSALFDPDQKMVAKAVGPVDFNSPAVRLQIEKLLADRGEPSDPVSTSPAESL